MNQRVTNMCKPRRIHSEDNFFHQTALVNERIDVDQQFHRPKSVDNLRSQKQYSKNTTPDKTNFLNESRRVLAEARSQRRQRHLSSSNTSRRRAVRSGNCTADDDDGASCYGNSAFDHFTLIRENKRCNGRASKQTDDDFSEQIAEIMQELKLCNSKLIQGLSRMNITDPRDKSVSASVTQFLQKCDGVFASIDEENMRRQAQGTKTFSDKKKSCSSLHGLMTTKRQSSFRSYRSDDVLLRRRRSSVRFDLSKNQEFLLES